jgi:hypothetical protein
VLPAVELPAVDPAVVPPAVVAPAVIPVVVDPAVKPVVAPVVPPVVPLVAAVPVVEPSVEPSEAEEVAPLAGEVLVPWEVPESPVVLEEPAVEAVDVPPAALSDPLPLPQPMTRAAMAARAQKRRVLFISAYWATRCRKQSEGVGEPKVRDCGRNFRPYRRY